MQNPEIKCKKKQKYFSHNSFFIFFVGSNPNCLNQILVINVWTTDQQNTKTNKKLLSSDEAAANRLRLSGNPSSFNVGQGKYTQNSQLALNKLTHKFNNQLMLSDQPGSSSVSDISAFLHHRPLTQSNSIASQSDSHNNYVEIDTLETLLYKNQQQSDTDNFPQYSNTPYNPQAEYSDSQHDQLAAALSSPIYENQAIVRRSESPIYSNTHNSQSISSLYSSQSQNLYSNLPSGLSNNNSAAQAAYANLPPSLHHGLVPAASEWHLLNIIKLL